MERAPRIVDGRLDLHGGRLASSAGNARHRWPERGGWLLRLVDESGAIGLGEASPLPGYSPDTLEETGEVLGQCLRRLPLRLAGRSLEDVESWLGGLPPLAPAARFAVETAVLDLLGQRLRQPLAGLLGAGPESAPPPLAGLVMATEPEAALSEARATLARGARTLKVKVGRAGRFEQELEILALLRTEFGNDLALRLDANGQLAANDIDRCLEQLARCSPQLIEEPLSGLALAAIERSPIPLAADETLQRPRGWQELQPLIDRALLRAIVLKPMALGGSLKCLDLAHQATERGVGVLVTHLFDGPVALAAAGALAQALPSPRLACGLDVHPGLGVWPAFERSATGFGLGLEPPKEPP